MSNSDGSYDDGNYGSEYDVDHVIELHEPYVPPDVEDLRHTTPVVHGQPPMLISNKDLLDQLYLMGDALNQYKNRLDSMKSRIERRSEQRGRHNRAQGKQPMIEGGTLAAEGWPERRFQMITSHELQYSTDVHVKEISD